MTAPLMPKATAVWLIEKTSLTFEQVADFVGMHPLEVQAIADGEVAQVTAAFEILERQVFQPPGRGRLAHVPFRSRVVVDVRFGHLGQAAIGASFLVEGFL